MEVYLVYSEAWYGGERKAIFDTLDAAEAYRTEWVRKQDVDIIIKAIQVNATC